MSLGNSGSSSRKSAPVRPADLARTRRADATADHRHRKSCDGASGKERSWRRPPLPFSIPATLCTFVVSMASSRVSGGRMSTRRCWSRRADHKKASNDAFRRDAMMAAVRWLWMGGAGKQAQRAIACNGLRHRWQLWHSEQSRICNLHSHLDAAGFKSHLRHAL